MPRQPSREPSIQSLSITAASRSHPYASTQQPSQRLTDESHVRQASHRTRQNALRTAEETSAVATLQAMSNTQHNLSILHKVMTSHLSKYKGTTLPRYEIPENDYTGLTHDELTYVQSYKKLYQAKRLLTVRRAHQPESFRAVDPAEACEACRISNTLCLLPLRHASYAAGRAKGSGDSCASCKSGCSFVSRSKGPKQRNTRLRTDFSTSGDVPPEKTEVLEDGPAIPGISDVQLNTVVLGSPEVPEENEEGEVHQEHENLGSYSQRGKRRESESDIAIDSSKRRGATDYRSVQQLDNTRTVVREGESVSALPVVSLNSDTETLSELTRSSPRRKRPRRGGHRNKATVHPESSSMAERQTSLTWMEKYYQLSPGVHTILSKIVPSGPIVNPESSEGYDVYLQPETARATGLLHPQTIIDECVAQYLVKILAAGNQHLREILGIGWTSTGRLTLPPNMYYPDRPCRECRERDKPAFRCIFLNLRLARLSEEVSLPDTRTSFKEDRVSSIIQMTSCLRCLAEDHECLQYFRQSSEGKGIPWTTSASDIPEDPGGVSGSPFLSKGMVLVRDGSGDSTVVDRRVKMVPISRTIKPIKSSYGPSQRTSPLPTLKSHLGMIALDYGSHPASTDFMSAASAIRPYILRLVNSPGSTVNLDPPAGDFHFRPSLITASSNISSSAPWSTQALSTFDLRCTDIVQNLIGKEGSQGLTDEVMGLLLAGIGISTATAGVRIDYPLRLTREGRLTRGMSLRTWDRVTGMRNAKMGFRRFLGLVFFEAEGTWAGYDYCNPGSSIGSENPARSEKGRSLIVYLRKDSAWREEYAAVICDHVRQFSASPSVSLPLQFLYVANVERVDTGLIILDIIRSILRSEVAGTSSSVQELLASDRPALDEVKIQLARMVVWQQKVFTDVLRAAGERQRWLIDAVSEIDREGRVTELETGDDDGNDDG